MNSDGPGCSTAILETSNGKVYGMPIEAFLFNVLPPLRPGLSLDGMFDRGAFRNAVSPSGKLWGYTKKNPSEVHSRDVKAAFAPLQRGIHSILETLEKEGYKPTLTFHTNQKGEDNYDERKAEFLPDAFFLPVTATTHSVQWSDVALSGEYKRDNSPHSVTENIKKVSDCMWGCMRYDPRRRFTYGFTIEDTSVKLWFCSRAQTVVSDPFDFLVRYSAFLYFVVSVSLAESHQLGWDPTLIPINRDGDIQYDVTVRSAKGEAHIYRASQLLSDSGAYDITGSGTRVWKARRVVDGEETGDPVALKDTWVHAAHEREGDVSSQLLQSDYLTKHKELRNHFVRVQVHGDVFVEDVRDHTIIPLKSNNPEVMGSAPWNRTHYRIVYEEVGVPLVEVTSLHTAFEALIDVIDGIRALHKAGWVHCDLSAGNILLVDGVWKITDFEVAENEAGYNRLLHLKGTPLFMSIEAYSPSYLFQPLEKPRKLLTKKTKSICKWFLEHFSGGLGDRFDHLSTRSEDDSSISSASVESVLEPQEKPRRHEFRYNPLHDLESLWWNAVYFVVMREVDLDTPRSQILSRQDCVSPGRVVAWEVLETPYNRQQVFLVPGRFSEQLEHLDPSLAYVARHLEDLRVLLKCAYSEAEKSIGNIDYNVAENLYDHFRSRCEKVARHLRKKNIRIRRVNDHPAGVMY